MTPEDFAALGLGVLIAYYVAMFVEDLVWFVADRCQQSDREAAFLAENIKPGQGK